MSFPSTSVKSICSLSSYTSAPIESRILRTSSLLALGFLARFAFASWYAATKFYPDRIRDVGEETLKKVDQISRWSINILVERSIYESSATGRTVYTWRPDGSKTDWIYRICNRF